MRLAVLKERRAGETRVAATPETVRKLVALGLSVAVETGAGAGASIPDADYAAAGAEVAADPQAALTGAGVVFAVQPPDGRELAAIPRGALLVCISGAMADRASVPGYAAAGIDVAAMELLPRITRAQSMDILSSQANLAGYRAVIEGAYAFDRGFPMMMTAAGTVPPARVFVVGAGVAGLQAIATARRLGAIVSATDVRPAAKEEIKSLGGAFVGVEDTETAGQTGAYAKEMSQDFRRKQAELMTATVAKNDLVICTALVQGGRAPVLVTQAMVDGMKPGSVVVDIAADGGGNCEATRPGEAYVTARGVKILGYRNWPGRISVAASNLYSKNLLTFLTTFWDKDTRAPKLPADDAIVQGVMLTRDGAVVHANFADAAPALAGKDAAAEENPSASSATVPGLKAAEDAGGAVHEPGEIAPVASMVEAPLTEPSHSGEAGGASGSGSLAAEPTEAGVYGEAVAPSEPAAVQERGLPPGDGLAPGHAAVPAGLSGGEDGSSASAEPVSGAYGEALEADAPAHQATGLPPDDGLAAGDGQTGSSEQTIVAAYGEGMPSAAADAPEHEAASLPPAAGEAYDVSTSAEPTIVAAYGEGMPSAGGDEARATPPDPPAPGFGPGGGGRGGGGRRGKGGQNRPGQRPPSGTGEPV